MCTHAAFSWPRDSLPLILIPAKVGINLVDVLENALIVHAYGYIGLS